MPVDLPSINRSASRDLTGMLTRSVVPSSLLRTALLIDAVVSGAMGVLQLVATDWLATLTSLPSALLFESGLFFVVYASLLVVLARCARVRSSLIGFIVIGNVGFAIACAALLLSTLVSPSGLGKLFVLLQLDAVLVFAALEWRGLVRSKTATASRAIAG